MSNICILGDVLVDISLKAKGNPLKMRLGGIVHAARALWAMNIQYTVAYFAPNYLDSSIKKYLAQLGNPLIIKLGDVESCPYVMLIEEVKEVGDQGYEFLLREDIKISYNEAEIQKLNQFDEIFLISGNYDFDKIGNSISRNCKLHYDAANNIYNFSCIEKHNYKFETIFISTSSPFFKSQYSEATFSINSYFHQFERLCRKIILKENRGGSRAYNFKNR